MGIVAYNCIGFLSTLGECGKTPLLTTLAILCIAGKLLSETILGNPSNSFNNIQLFYTKTKTKTRTDKKTNRQKDSVYFVHCRVKQFCAIPLLTANPFNLHSVLPHFLYLIVFNILCNIPSPQSFLLFSILSSSFIPLCLNC